MIFPANNFSLHHRISLKLCSSWIWIYIAWNVKKNWNCATRRWPNTLIIARQRKWKTYNFFSLCSIENNFDFFTTKSPLYTTFTHYYVTSLYNPSRQFFLHFYFIFVSFGGVTVLSVFWCFGIGRHMEQNVIFYSFSI